MTIYKPTKECTKEILQDNNFKYIDGYYVYRFPVYKYNKTPILWGQIIIDLESTTCYVSVVNNTNNVYAAYHNREYGKNEVLIKIDKTIETQISQLVKIKILKVVK